MNTQDPQLTIKLLTCEIARKNAVLKALIKTLFRKDVLTQQEILDILAAHAEAGNEAAIELDVTPG